MEVNTSRAPNSAPHGVKRRAEEEPREEQRLAKRFDLLNLEQNGKLYVPVSQAPSHKTADEDNSMHIDDTKDKIYIHNLDEEIASIYSAEDMIFLPDIEKKIGKIPQHILTGGLQPSAENQMVLYGVPTSLSVPKNQDSVRKAIIESRVRAQEKKKVDALVSEAAQDDGGNRLVNGDHFSIGHGPPKKFVQEQPDDAMDIG